MIRVTFILPDERVIEAAGEVGDSLMEVATRHDVPGISGDCGGCLRDTRAAAPADRVALVLVRAETSDRRLTGGA